MKTCGLQFLLFLLVLDGSVFADSGTNAKSFVFRDNERVAFVGNSLAERMNLFGHFETRLHLLHSEKQLLIRNFGWPADEVRRQQRPDNYTKIDDPMRVFSPELFFCFFGFNEHFHQAEDIDSFKSNYARWLTRQRKTYSAGNRPVRFVLVSPIAFEQTLNLHLPDGRDNNRRLAAITDAIAELADLQGLRFVDLFTPTRLAFEREPGAQYTINGIHVNETGDRLVAEAMCASLFGKAAESVKLNSAYERLRESVNDKSWLHLQDYRMLNGWYVYGGRRTWDTDTFPSEYKKIRKMVAVRDRYIWDQAAGKPVAPTPDDSKTGEVFVPDSMFGTRGDNFRKMREPQTLKYPTPEESIAQMDVLQGMEVQLFASEREFPELANPTQIGFDNRGRLWVSCMVNYPQWLPGSAKPGDKLLILEDTDNDGKADLCKTFWDKLICPTGFEFYQDGVLVVDEPRIIFLQDTNGDDKADQVTHLIDGIATDDTHHTMGAWEWSHGGRLYMLEGIAMSTTIETPWGPFRRKGPSGSYVWDPDSCRIRHFKTPSYGNPWCMVFDRWGMGVIGDGTIGQQHWTSPLSGYSVGPRKTLQPNFDNEGLRPAVGNEFLYSRHFPDELQGQFVYGCVIDLHGLPRFEIHDENRTAGFTGRRLADLVNSTDNFLRPVDPQIGPDGALWFGDWCNALIGHMQYSQRDPNRDHVHGRIYRLINKNKPLLKPELQHEKDVYNLLHQLTSHELRTRYRARRELRRRDKTTVLAAINDWITDKSNDQMLCEAMWIQESFHAIDPQLITRIMGSGDFHARAAAVHAVANEATIYNGALVLFCKAIGDPHPRVRLESLRGLSFIQNKEATEIALKVLRHPTDYWIDYTLEHTLHALKKFVPEPAALVNCNDTERAYYAEFVFGSIPGSRATVPLKVAQDPESPRPLKLKAVNTLAKLKRGNPRNGKVVFQRVCSACHQIQGRGRAFGPALDGIAARYERQKIIEHILWPNDEIAKGYETVQVLTLDGDVFNGFVVDDNESSLILGVATDDGKGKQVTIAKEEIDEQKRMNASSMPEGLVKTIAPTEFLDLIAFLAVQRTGKDGWMIAGGDQSNIATHQGLVEVSRDAKIKLGSDFPEHWNTNAHLVFDPVAAKKREFAFHSANKLTERPSVTIQLSQIADVGRILIQNRVNSEFQDRAQDLAVFVSTDNHNWQQVWRANKGHAEYDIDLPSGTIARYVKFEIQGKGILHLNHIMVLGR